jgi:Flp pilus assembly protein TadG
MSARRGGDDGLVLAWMALFITVLLTCAGLAVDVGYWYLVANRVQAAADAGALAGVTYLPDDPAEATTSARALSARNGFEHGVDATAVTAEQLAKPSQLKVTVSTEAATFFASIIGLDHLTIRRDATAEFEGPIPMGSPVNTMGNEPLATGEPQWSTGSVNPQFWVNIAGPGTTKISGDRHQAGTCASNVSGCSGATNVEYAPDGYVFAIRVPEGADVTKRLAVEIFDPAFVQVGDTCTDPTLDNAASLDPSTPSRYAAGPSSRYCTGDHEIADTTDNPVTTFIMREPDESPWIDTDNPVIQPTNVSIDSPGAVGSECGPKQYRPFNGGSGSIRAQLQSSPAFAAYFRRWVRICTIPISGPGEYLLQIRTNALVGSPLAAASGITARGHNRFAIRAALVDSGGAATGSGIHVYANGRLPIYANAQGANTQFFLARLLPGNDGRYLRIEFFDTGDASQAGTIQILPPTDSNKTVFTGCEFQRDGAGPVMSDTCSLTGVSSGAGYNGKTVDAQVPVPDGYTCNEASQTGCWVRLRFTYPAGTTVNDTTTWSAAMTGDPVRLIE